MIPSEGGESTTRARRRKRESGSEPGVKDRLLTVKRVGYGPAESQESEKVQKVAESRKVTKVTESGPGQNPFLFTLRPEESGPESGVKDSYPPSREVAESRKYTTFVTFWQESCRTRRQESVF